MGRGDHVDNILVLADLSYIERNWPGFGRMDWNANGSTFPVDKSYTKYYCAP